MKKIVLLVTFTAVLFALACGSGGDSAGDGKTIKSGPAGNNLTATLSNADGVLRKGKQTFTLTFSDAAGKPVDVGSASLNFFMPAMGSMSAMNNQAALSTTSTPGVYAANADIEMSGEWQAQIKYEGAAGKGNTTIAISAQ